MTIDLYAEQEQLEGMMRGMTASRFQEIMSYKVSHKEEAATYYGTAMLKRAVEPLKLAIEAFMQEAKSGKAGPKHSALKQLVQIEPSVAAFICAKTILDQITVGSKLQKTALTVALKIEDELRYAQFEKEHGGLFNVLQKKVAGDTERRKRTILVMRFNQYCEGFVGWTQTERLHLGMKLIELFAASTGYVEVTTRVEGKNKTVDYLVATKAVLDWVENQRESASLLQPVYLPMVIEPQPWEGTRGGGYLTPQVKPLSLVKTRNKTFLREMDGMKEQLGDVFDAVNSLQAVKWQVNRQVLDVMKTIWTGGQPIAKLPPRDEIPLPVSPLAPDRDTETLSEDETRQFKEWKRAVSKVYTFNLKLRSRRMQVAKIISIAEQFAKYEAIYFPYTLDFRGRVYAVPMFLTPQGSKQAKGLLHFAEGKPLGNERAAGWLAIHGANVWGEDKVSFDDRIAWVEAHQDRILRVAADPLADLWWSEADSPWQFLAFCFEWKGWIEQGVSFVSHLPVALDGSCSGLQHFSAALRDEVGGSAVNLVPHDKPADVYQQVIDKVITSVREDLTTSGSEEAKWAAEWLSFGMTRNTAKRATMTVPYGSTHYSCRSFVQEFINEAIESKREKDPSFDHLFCEEDFAASMYLAPKVWDAISRTVIAAREAMDWLRQCSSLLAKEQLPVTWTTPDGFPVFQRYMDTSLRRVKTKFGDKLVYLSISEESNDKLDTRRQSNGVAPNWVHSMDGTHLRMAVNTASDNGVNSFAVVHDSFGTHAADTDVLAASLKETFVALYQGDVLLDFKNEVSAILSEGVEFPEIPSMGSLDLEEVKQSDFIFA